MKALIGISIAVCSLVSGPYATSQKLVYNKDCFRVFETEYQDGKKIGKQVVRQGETLKENDPRYRALQEAIALIRWWEYKAEVVIFADDAAKTDEKYKAGSQRIADKLESFLESGKICAEHTSDPDRMASTFLWDYPSIRQPAPNTGAQESGLGAPAMLVQNARLIPSEWKSKIVFNARRRTKRPPRMCKTIAVYELALVLLHEGGHLFDRFAENSSQAQAEIKVYRWEMRQLLEIFNLAVDEKNKVLAGAVETRQLRVREQYKLHHGK